MANKPGRKTTYMTNPFTDTYKKLPTSKLLSILENRKDYQAMAIEAAELEIAGRKDIAEVKQQLEEQKVFEKQKVAADKQKQENIKHKAFKILGYADPFIEKTPEKSVVLICVLLFTLFLYKVVTNFGILSFSFQNPRELDGSGVWFLIEYFYLPVSIFLVWRKSNMGWAMLLIWLIYQCLLDVIGLYLSFSLLGVESPLMNLMPIPGISTYLFILALHGGFIYVISRPNIKSLFKQKESYQHQ